MGRPDAEILLEGPRGRFLCWSLLGPGDYPGWDRVWDGMHTGALTGLTDELVACVARTDLDSLVTHADELALLAAAWCSRWKPPCTGRNQMTRI
jgi:hypothetical protein